MKSFVLSLLALVMAVVLCGSIGCSTPATGEDQTTDQPGEKKLTETTTEDGKLVITSDEDGGWDLSSSGSSGSPEVAEATDEEKLKAAVENLKEGEELTVEGDETGITSVTVTETKEIVAEEEAKEEPATEAPATEAPADAPATEPAPEQLAAVEQAVVVEAVTEEPAEEEVSLPISEEELNAAADAIVDKIVADLTSQLTIKLSREGVKSLIIEHFEQKAAEEVAAKMLEESADNDEAPATQ